MLSRTAIRRPVPHFASAICRDSSSAALRARVAFLFSVLSVASCFFRHIRAPRASGSAPSQDLWQLIEIDVPAGQNDSHALAAERVRCFPHGSDRNRR